MKKKWIMYVIAFLYAGFSLPGYANHCVLVQVPNLSNETLFTDKEALLANNLAKDLKNMDIKAIYTSDEPYALQTAELIARYHEGIPVQVLPALRTLAPNTLFQRVGEIRNHGVNAITRHLDELFVVVTSESIVQFAGRYIEIASKKIPNFSYIELPSLEEILERR